jgi:hypothetical protein
MVKEKKPLMIFLMETKLKAAKVEVLCVQLRFGSVFVVDSVWDVVEDWPYFGGRKLELISKTIVSDILMLSSNFGNCMHLWKFTGFYGHPEPGKRKEPWSLLKLLHSFSSEAWLCVRDFNEIAEDSEDFGIGPRALWQMADFREVLDYTQLRDLGFEGAKFTWLNKREMGPFYKRMFRSSFE